ncbi:hypothetical protein UB43_09925 [Pseudomonas sp. 21]|uniref:hypothetical protein n=1 Tax=unclassified Pseudomonas TaxID=196821 RepID=UPI0005EB01D9|nr:MULTISPECIES: hypothetical protein [unclassified Pseudomonas]KJK00735.1 hypothetical protein UB43_09925 [Pseudomonas sp. 21]MBV7581588.1 hypothetical protein [Pseudomonas sp. PDM33]
MDIRIAVHPSDDRRWRVYLNQFFYDCNSRSAAERIYARVSAAERQSIQLPEPPRIVRPQRVPRRQVQIA